MATTWISCTAAVPGEQHVRSGTPCQDAVAASGDGRPHVAVFDGRGSAQFAELGSSAAAAAIAGIIDGLEPVLRVALDDDSANAAELWRAAGQAVLRQLRAEQRRVAHEAEIAVDEVEFTVSIAVMGQRRVGIIQRGDSALLIARVDGTVSLAAARQTGDYAGETYFLGDKDETIDLADFPHIAADDSVALLAVSDGVAAGWFDATNGAVAPGVRTVIARLRSGEWTSAHLLQHLRQKFWGQLPDDDRSVAAIVRALDSSEPTQCPA